MAKKTPEEIEALKQAAAQKKEAARLAAEKKASDDKAAAERAALIKKLTELEFPASLEDLSNEDLKRALDAYNLVANQGAKAGVQVTQIITNAITAQPQPGTEQPKNNLEDISNIAIQEKIPALWITSRPESFCRCGRRFTREGYGIALDVLTDDEIERLKTEPNLFVEEVDALIDNVEH